MSGAREQPRRCWSPMTAPRPWPWQTAFCYSATARHTFCRRLSCHQCSAQGDIEGVYTVMAGLVPAIHVYLTSSSPSPLDQKHDLARHAIGNDLVVLNHAFGLFHPKRHDPTQGLGGFRDGGATRIVEADLGMHGDIYVTYNWHLRLRRIRRGLRSRRDVDRHLAGQVVNGMIEQGHHVLMSRAEAVVEDYEALPRRNEP